MPLFLKTKKGLQMKKVLFYLMKSEKMCAMHALMNANQIIENGGEAKIIFEGKSVKLPSILEKEKNPIYKRLKENGSIVGVCEACSKMLEVYEINKDLGLNFLSDMNGHAGMIKYLEEGYQVIEF